ncbi:hypothetical protein M501DRAFT_1004531 [Patellaria atrata CBS 101060]|uniref:N-acetyltransferase domain-containing protein n=1 Tax=Patellaria atrata CBS 101060 TaxID=1346257 RepID=A0A9P4S9W3_9PEZI|nr:hypothetical protein M501DRAFT_1004531 [Patellaria atrata CBS 101060]
MDPVIFTPRLKLTLITSAERGSKELEWLHELRSDEKAMFWSIYPRSTSISDTEKAIKAYLPTRSDSPEKSYRIVYAVHVLLDPKDAPSCVSASIPPEPHSQPATPTRFIGLTTLVSVGANGLSLPQELTLPAVVAATTLTVELAYSFLPQSWNKGYATEAISAVFDACKRVPSFWMPWEKVYVRAIVNAENPASLRVMEKSEMAMRGIYEWTGKAIFVAGQWKERDTLHIFGGYLMD